MITDKDLDRWHTYFMLCCEIAVAAYATYWFAQATFTGLLAPCIVNGMAILFMVRMVTRSSAHLDAIVQCG